MKNYTDLSPVEQILVELIALYWVGCQEPDIRGLLDRLGMKHQGKPFTQSLIKEQLQQLKKAGVFLHKEDAQHFTGFVRSRLYHSPQMHILREPLRTQAYEALLDRYEDQQLKTAFYGQIKIDPQFDHWLFYGSQATLIAFLHFVHIVEPWQVFHAWEERISRSGWTDIIKEVFLTGPFPPRLMGRLDPWWRPTYIRMALDEVFFSWNPAYLEVLDWGLEYLMQVDTSLEPSLADLLQLSGRSKISGRIGIQAIEGLEEAIHASSLLQQGEWAKAQAGFEAALQRSQKAYKIKKNLLSIAHSWFYPLALLAQGSSAQLETAIKFCITESGSRKPDPSTHWGLWVHACQARLGQVTLQKRLFAAPDPTFPRALFLGDLWKLLLRAWLRDILPLAASGTDRTHYDSWVAAIKSRLAKLKLDWYLKLAEAADQLLRGESPEIPFFAEGDQNAWRLILDALLALGGSNQRTKGRVGDIRIIWEVKKNDQGVLLGIRPLQQKLGKRSWNKPTNVGLDAFKDLAAQSAQDGQLLQLMEVDSYRRFRFVNLAQAIEQLIGHPRVVLADSHDTFVELVGATAQLETVRGSGKNANQIQLRINPAPHKKIPNRDDYDWSGNERDYQDRHFVHLLQESTNRIKVISFTPAQRKAAQLLAGGFKVPTKAQNELQSALQVLAGHFEIHSDEITPSRELEAKASLRAELSPQGEALVLRLVAAPFGVDGPRLMPGRGKKRLLATIDGELLGTQRDLKAESAHLEQVLERLEFLDPPDASTTSCEWCIEDPELSLAMVELLPQLPAIEALDWPKGKAIRVKPVEQRQIKVSLATERGWFRVDGGLELDEGRVLNLQQLLAAAANKSRFIAMGEGEYLALSKALQDRLNALSAVIEQDKSGLKAPELASVWLNEGLDGFDASFDTQFKARIRRLHKAQGQDFRLPATLMAELRPYQEEGYGWMMRLAAAGFGACLADDMGLGKTLQTLAVLLARAQGGPALVVAPTSVCGNWLAETYRFAPALRVSIYGEAELGRQEQIKATGPGDLLIVSYTLMQQASEDFAAHRWHTLVADEAQAVKNAATKRSQALFELDADLRLALSGTPVENRLAELWSIMRFCNPGLLSTQGRFSERFATPIERNRDRDAQRLLRRLIAPFVLRRTKSQVLDDLPERTELVLSVVPDADEAAYYEALRRTLLQEAEGLDANAGQTKLHILAQLTKLRRAACDPRLATPELGLIGAKVRTFADLAMELAANGHKTLVFSQFVDFLTLLRAPLDEAGLAYQYLDGSTPAAERSKRVAAFQNGEGDFFLISLKAGGFGLNLTAADYVVITDPWWNPAAEDQAMGRAHRIGQQRPVTVYRLVGKGTLEERIIELHQDKRALADGVLAEDGEAVTLPSTEELLALLRG